MNTILLLEQSYIDSNMSQFLIRYFNLQYGLKYFKNSYGSIPGNIGSLIGNFSEDQFSKLVPMVLNDLQNYQPFLQFLGCFYKGYWFSKRHIDEVNPYKLTSFNKVQIPLNYILLIENFDQAFNSKMFELILLLDSKHLMK